MNQSLDVAAFVEEFKDILVTLFNDHFLHVKIALTKIAKLLTTMCETHKLPLARTWVPRIVTCHAMNVIENNDIN
jgi:hypothetical protein